jgi:hypothetical protein
MRGTNMTVKAYPYRGNITLKLEYRDCFLFFRKWHTNTQFTLYQNFFSSLKVFGSNRDRRASVLDATGDGYHWTVYSGGEEACENCSAAFVTLLADAPAFREIG